MSAAEFGIEHGVKDRDKSNAVCSNKYFMPTAYSESTSQNVVQNWKV